MLIGAPIPPAGGTGPASVGVGWPTSRGDGCPTTTDPGGIPRPTGGSGTTAGPGVRRGFTGPTVVDMSVGVLLVGTLHGGGVAAGATGGATTAAIILVMEVVITRLTVAGAVVLGGAMSSRMEPATVPPAECGPHGRSGPPIWFWTWRDERAEPPWTAAPGRWSPSVILPVLGSVESSGQVATH